MIRPRVILKEVIVVPAVQASIEEDNGALQLVNDQVSPGNNKVYGTDGSGTKGWKNDPSGGGGGNVSVYTVSTNTVIPTPTSSVVYLVDTTSGNVQITLSLPLATTHLITVKKIASANQVTVVSPLGTIDDGASAVLLVKDASIDLISNGTNYKLV